MTMRIVFLKEHDGNKRGQEKFIDRPEAIKLCEKGTAVPFDLYEKIQRKETKAKEAEKKAKAKIETEKKAELLKKKEAEKKAKADSKKPKKAERAVKK